jgi:hypothetical protein
MFAFIALVYACNGKAHANQITFLSNRFIVRRCTDFDTSVSKRYRFFFGAKKEDIDQKTLA